MVILGIDPGTARLGYGLLKKNGASLVHIEHGCFETSKNMTQAERLHELYTLLTEVIKKHQPVLVGVEKLFFAKNAKTAMVVSEARGIVLLAAQMNGLKIFEYTPMQIKQAVTGYGGADKKQIQEMVCRIMKLDEIPKPDDAADALAIAYTTAVSYELYAKIESSSR